jgi:SulP family sulfate permease
LLSPAGWWIPRRPGGGVGSPVAAYAIVPNNPARVPQRKVPVAISIVRRKYIGALGGATAATASLWSKFKTEFAPDGIVPSVTAGAVALMLVVIESVAYAALIFSGPLAPYIGTGIAIALTSAVVCGLIAAVFSSYPGVVAFSQNKIAAIFALIAATTFELITPPVPAEIAMFSAAAAIFISTIITGAVLATLGTFKLGIFIRYIPYPVICGFLAAVGWLLLLGSIRTMTGAAVTFATAPELFKPDRIMHWLPGLAFALAALVLLSQIKHYAVMPVLIVASTLIFYAAFFASGMSLEEARHGGWLVHTATTDGQFHMITFEAFAQAHWKPIIAQIGGLATVVLVTAVALLLNSSALELAAEQEMDLDHELKIIGVANIASGLVGGMVGFTSINISKFVLRMGVKGRLVGLFCALGCAAVLIFGTAAINYVPVPLVGGLLLFIGIEFLIEWIYKPARELPRIDFVIVAIILAIVGVFGFIEGIMVGMVLAIIFFAIKYSSVSAIKQAFSVADEHSNVDRPPDQKKVLEQQGGMIQVFRLNGFIFFGSANTVLGCVRQRINDRSQIPLRYLVFDFHAVTGIDSSAVISLIKLAQLARKSGIIVVLTEVSGIATRQMKKGGLHELNQGTWRTFPSLDHGLEWCEDQLLGIENAGRSVEKRTIQDYLEELFPGVIEYTLLAKYLTRLEIPAGHILIKQGQPSDALYLLESGLVTVIFNLEGGGAFRVRKMGPGTIIGELGLYLNSPRTADVITEEPSVIYCLSRENMKLMNMNEPKIAAAFHDFMVRLLADRLVRTDRILKTLLN